METPSSAYLTLDPDPCVIFGELIFGVRVAKVTLIDKESDKPQRERTYVPCPHCETLNDSRLWGKGISLPISLPLALVRPCVSELPSSNSVSMEHF